MRSIIHRGFTVVELLVVITIIVVLLALLTPGLERAIYLTELTKCGANLRSIGMGALQYALDGKRRYPARSGIGGNWQPQDLVQTSNQPGDDRPKLRPYMSLNGHLNCPLTRKIDIEGSKPTSWLLAPYAFWFGWQFNNGAVSHAGLFRIGDRLAWQDLAQGPLRFSVLASDHDLIIESQGWGHGTHPDTTTGRWGSVALQDQSLFGVPAVGIPGNTEATLSRWTGPPHDRGPIEMSFAMQDGSVERLEEVRWDEASRSDRIARVPYTSAANIADRGQLWNNLRPD